MNKSTTYRKSIQPTFLILAILLLTSFSSGSGVDNILHSRPWWGLTLDTLGTTVDTGTGLIGDNSIYANFTVPAQPHISKPVFGVIMADVQSLDLSSSQYMEIKYKSDKPFVISLHMTHITDLCYYQTSLPSTNGNWKIDTLYLSTPEFFRPSWGSGSRAFDLTKLQDIHFETSFAGSTGSIEIQHLGFEGITEKASYLLLDTPVGSSILNGGDIAAVKWRKKGITGDVKLEYSTNSGATWADIGQTLNDGEYQWTIPAVNSEFCRVKISSIDAPAVIDTTFELFTIVSQSTARELDSLALVALYDSCNGTRWLHRSNWKSTEPIENWYGVTCANGRVTALTLANNALTGAIPIALGNCTELYNLELHNNAITRVPESIENLTKLVYLHLENNDLTELPYGIGSLTNLAHLFANHNRLITIPTSIGGMNSLQHLHLESNQITHLPAQIGSVTALQLIILDGNQLQMLPSELGELSQLSTLYAHSNRLDTIQAELFKKPNYALFHIAGNALGFDHLELFRKHKGLVGNDIRNQDSVGVSQDISLPAGGTHAVDGTIPGTQNRYAWLSSTGDTLARTAQYTITESGSYSCNVYSDSVHITLHSRPVNVTIAPSDSNLLLSREWWGVSHDQLGTTVDTGAALIGASSVKATFAVTSSGGAGYPAFGAIMGDVSMLDISNSGYMKVRYKSDEPFKAVLHMTHISDFSFYEEPLPSTNGEWQTVELQLNSSVFRQPSWKSGSNTFDLAEVEDIHFETGFTRSTGSIEISYLGFEGIKAKNQYLLLDSPSDKDILNIGDTKVIKWRKLNVTGDVKLEYSTNGGTSWDLITTTANDGEHPWSVPSIVSTTCKMRITSIATPSLVDSSYGLFTIDGQLPERKADSLALVALYDNCNGANWINNTNWKSAEPIENWFGITCYNGRVTEIDLTNNGLTNDLPAQLGNCDNVWSLILRGNSLTTVPQSIGNMRNLQTLHLGNNNLTVLPDEIGLLTNLMMFSVSGNQLTSLPNSIGSFANLLEFFADSNQITQLPATIGNMTKTHSIHIRKNQLTTLPTEMANLNNLRYIFAHNNNIDSVPVPLLAKGIGKFILEQNYLDFHDIEQYWHYLPGLGGFANQKRFGNVLDTAITASEILVLDGTIGGSRNNYTWFKDGAIVATTAQFTVTQSGTYHCAVSSDLKDGFTLESNRKTVTVAGVAITTQPISLTRHRNETAQFTIVAKGENLVYQWRKNNVDMDGETSYVLTLDALQYSDAGDYRCVVSNRTVRVISDSADLYIRNQVPTLTSVTNQSVNKNGSIVLDLAMTVSEDKDGDPLTLVIESGEHYTFTGTTITPATDWTQDLAVNVKVFDDEDYSSTKTMTISIVQTGNEAPTVGSAKSQTIDEDTPLTITLDMLENVNDPEGSPLSIVIGTGDHFTVEGATITPTANWTETLSVPIQVSDGELLSNVVMMNVTITPVNDAPTLTNLSNQEITEDTPLTVTLDMLNDEFDVDGDQLSVTIGTGDNYTVNGTTITPTPNWTEALSIPIQVSDGELLSSVVMMNVTITPINDAPTVVSAQNMSMFKNSSLPITLDMITGENDVDGDQLSVVVENGANYTVSGTTVTPAIDWTGTLTVLVRVTDGELSSATTPMAIVVRNGENTAPTVESAINQIVAEDGTLNITLDMLNGEADSDNDPLTVVIENGANYTVNGTSITPTQNWTQTLTVPVKVSDGNLQSAPVNMTVSITPQNDAPTIASAINQTVAEDGTLAITLDMLKDVRDIENDPLTVVIENGSNYTVNGTSITPTQNWTQALTVPVKVTDGSLNSNIVNMIVAITPENDAPTVNSAIDQTIPMNEQFTITMGMLNGEEDVDGDDLTIIAEATANCAIDGATITPTADWSGTIELSIKVSDGTLTSDAVTMTLTVEKKVALTEITASKIKNHLFLSPSPARIGSEGVRFVAPEQEFCSWEITIFDALGNLVERREFDSSFEDMYLWDLTNRYGVIVSSGTYIAILKCTAEDDNVKMFKQVIGVKN